jgi:hypothetical protein
MTPLPELVMPATSKAQVGDRATDQRRSGVVDTMRRQLSRPLEENNNCV